MSRDNLHKSLRVSPKRFQAQNRPLGQKIAQNYHRTETIPSKKKGVRQTRLEV